MGYGLNDDGELALLKKYFKNEDVEIGIYYDDPDNGGDNLQDSDGLADVNEPSGSNYGRETITPSEVTIDLNSNNNARITIDTKTLSVGNSSMDVDSWFLYNANDSDFIGRSAIDTSDRQTDYINLDQIDSLRLAGETMVLD